MPDMRTQLCAGRLRHDLHANLFRDHNGEWGYISLPEIVANGAELDFHWTAKPLDDCLKER